MVIIGAGSYTILSRVFTSEAKRQGILQDNPCPGDRVVFTCIRNETSEDRIAVRWTANGTPLYTFGIPNDIGTPRANQDAGFPGLIGVLIDARTFTLSVDLSTSVDIINGTQVACGEVLNDISSPPMTLFVVGKWMLNTHVQMRTKCVKLRPFWHDRGCYHEFLDEKTNCKSSRIDLQLLSSYSNQLMCNVTILDWRIKRGFAFRRALIRHSQTLH